MSRLRFRSRTWDVITVVGIVLLVGGSIVGLTIVRRRYPGDASAALTVLVALGVVALALFFGPGVVYSAHKRIPVLTRRLPGSTMAWIRAHLYVPVLALVAAYVHATATPFDESLTSGKVTFAIAFLVVIAGIARNRLIGLLQRAATDGDPEVTASRHRRALHQYKLWRAAHVPLTIGFFLLVGYHVADVFGADHLPGSATPRTASADGCASCHAAIHEEWTTSAMAHAQTSALMQAQLPVTLAANAELVDRLGSSQQRSFDIASKTCINCHAPIGARDAAADALLPFSEPGTGGRPAVSGGGDEIHADGVSCVVCHSQEHAPPVGGGSGELSIASRDAFGYGTQYGPLFDDPALLPQRAHDIENSSLWGDPLATSQLCGACHVVEVDLNDDGRIAVADDLVLQTTYHEWEQYVAYREQVDDGAATVRRPLGCAECHMPRVDDGPLVDTAPGFLSVPDRARRAHSFVGVDYDLARDAFTPEELDEVLGARAALLGSAVTLEVQSPSTVDADVVTAQVRVRNNALGHTFPTGFAFARQFWLEVSAHTAEGQLVPLVTPPGFPSTPSVSGELVDATDDLPQCDVEAVAALTGVPAASLGNGDVRFAAAQPPGSCDPWLVSFQKILTDGDPDGIGVFHEVPYQSFLPGIVKTRARVVGELGLTPRQLMEPLSGGSVDPVTSAVTDPGEATFPYQFDASGVPRGTPLIVTAKLRFRHVAPDFVRSLADRVSVIDDAPASAKIDAEDLLERLVVTDVVDASSGEGEVLACRGPQNAEGRTILDCVAEGGTGTAAGPPRRRRTSTVAPWLLASVTLAAGTALAIGRRTRGAPIPWEGPARRIVVVSAVVTVSAVAGVVLTDAGVARTDAAARRDARSVAEVTTAELAAAVASAPTVVPMRLALVERYLDAGDVPAAQSTAVVALDLATDSDDRARALRLAGWTTALLGGAEEGATMLEESLAMAPSDRDAMWFLANVELVGLDDPARAVDLLETILSGPVERSRRSTIERRLDEARTAAGAKDR